MIALEINTERVMKTWTPPVGSTDSPWGPYFYPDRAEVSRISEILRPVVKAIVDEAAGFMAEKGYFEVDHLHNQCWTFFDNPVTVLDPNFKPEDEDDQDRYWMAQEFKITEPYTVWGWWQERADGVGGEFVTTKSGKLFVFFC